MARWLTVEEMADELRVTRLMVIKLIRKKKLAAIVQNYSGAIPNWRILDPSEEYKRALHTQAAIMSAHGQVDLMRVPLIGTGELSAITGLSEDNLRGLIHDGKLKPYKLGKFSAFSPEQVRELLLRRQRKEPRDRRARCEALIRWCLSYLEKHPEATLTREEVEADDQLEGTLRNILRQKEPDRTHHLAEFWRRFELAQQTARTLRAASAP